MLKRKTYCRRGGTISCWIHLVRFLWWYLSWSYDLEPSAFVFMAYFLLVAIHPYRNPRDGPLKFRSFCFCLHVYVALCVACVMSFIHHRSGTFRFQLYGSLLREATEREESSPTENVGAAAVEVQDTLHEYGYDFMHSEHLGWILSSSRFSQIRKN